MSHGDPLCPCDRCGQTILEGDTLYSVATKFDDDGRIVSARHWRCHVPIDVQLRQLRESMVRVEQSVRSLVRKPR